MVTEVPDLTKRYEVNSNQIVGRMIDIDPDEEYFIISDTHVQTFIDPLDQTYQSYCWEVRPTNGKAKRYYRLPRTILYQFMQSFMAELAANQAAGQIEKASIGEDIISNIIAQLESNNLYIHANMVLGGLEEIKVRWGEYMGSPNQLLKRMPDDFIKLIEDTRKLWNQAIADSITWIGCQAKAAEYLYESYAEHYDPHINGGDMPLAFKQKIDELGDSVRPLLQQVGQLFSFVSILDEVEKMLGKGFKSEADKIGVLDKLEQLLSKARSLFSFLEAANQERQTRKSV